MVIILHAGFDALHLRPIPWTLTVRRELFLGLGLVGYEEGLRGSMSGYLMRELGGLRDDDPSFR